MRETEDVNVALAANGAITACRKEAGNTSQATAVAKLGLNIYTNK